MVNCASTLSLLTVSIDRSNQAGRNATSALGTRRGRESELKSMNAAGTSSQRLPGSSLRSAMPSSHSSWAETSPQNGSGGKARISLCRKSEIPIVSTTLREYCDFSF